LTPVARLSCRLSRGSDRVRPPALRRRGRGWAYRRFVNHASIIFCADLQVKLIIT
jgi:anti-sigma factor RsiW